MAHDIAGVIIVLGTAVVLPVTIVFLSLKTKIESEKNKKEIILAALQNNTDINVEELVRKMNVPDILLKEKLLNKLQWGILTTLIGLGLIIYTTLIGLGLIIHHIIIGFAGGMLCSIVCLAIGIAFLLTYAKGKKMLAKEIEAEEQNIHHA